MVLHFRDVPLPLYRDLEAEARQLNVSVGSRLTRLLADAYAVPYEEKSRYRERQPSAAVISLHLPDELHYQLKLRAARERSSIRALILDLLQQRFE